MARIRSNKQLLDKINYPQSFIGWILFLLENIGRSSYRIIFSILKIICKSAYYVVYGLLYLSKIVVTKIIQLIKAVDKFIHMFIDKLLQPVGTRTHRPKIIFPKKPAIILPKLSLPNLPNIGLKQFFSILTLGISLILVFYFYVNIFKDLPGPNRLLTREQIVSTKIYDRNYKLLYTIFDGNHNRTLIKLNDIPIFVRQATIAIEDRDFYKHPGFSYKGILRALYRNLLNSNLEGGSTITQQLVKNALLTSDKTWQRKIKEIILSVQTELIFSKNEILQMYFNEVPYGGTAYGIAQASQTYLGKDIKDVTLAEGTLLAGLPAAPTRFSPFGANPKLALIRQHQVLDAMIKDGYITKEQANEAKNQKIMLAPQQTNIKAPHFVMYVKDLLVEQYGTKIVEQGGLTVITSLDLDIQEMAQNSVTEEVNKLLALRVSNGAALATNPKTGEILAMVGSKDYFDSSNDGNVNVTIMPRQIGSAIKPVTYALALGNGFSPATILSDTPITYRIPGAQDYSPVNYDSRFHGNVPLRIALASSYNVPAVKTLAALGVNKLIDLGEKMGITTWTQRNRYGLSLTLGAGEVKMIDMAEVYGTFANLGTKVKLKPILKVTDYKDRTFEDFEPGKSEKVLDPKVAYLITDILKDNQARAPSFGTGSFLFIPNHEVAVKTGTTNDKRDNWAIGYTEDLLTAVWVGNNDNAPMAAVASGVTGASPIWNHIMVSLLKNKPPQRFSRPDNLIKVAICSINGLLPCGGCPLIEEYFVPGNEPKYACNSEEIKKILEEQEKAKQDQILQGVSTQP